MRPTTLCKWTIIAAVSFAHIAHAESFVMPFSSVLHLEALGGEAADSATADFGLGTTQANFVPYLIDLAPNTNDQGEVAVGFFNVGETIHFGLRGEFGGATAWGFSNGVDLPSLTAFTDKDNSLGMDGSIIEQTALDTWVMHLDYPNVGGDDDDNAILIQIRLAPGGVDLTLTGCVACLVGDTFSANLLLLGLPPTPTELKLSFRLPDGSTMTPDRSILVKSSGLKFKQHALHTELPASFSFNGPILETTIAPDDRVGDWQVCARVLDLVTGEFLGESCPSFSVEP